MILIDSFSEFWITKFFKKYWEKIASRFLTRAEANRQILPHLYPESTVTEAARRY